MAVCSKAHAFKAMLLSGVLVFLFNFMSNHSETRVKDKFYFAQSSSSFFNKVKTNSSRLSNLSVYNVYTQLYNADNSTVKSVMFNPTVSETNHSNNIMVVDSTDFKRKFPFLHNESKSDKHSKKLSQGNSSTTSSFFQSLMTTLGLNLCPEVPSLLNGPVEINTTMESLDEIAQRLSGKVSPGGWYRPKECNARDRVALIVPFRDRYAHLPIFLKNIHPFLIKQQVEYAIFLVEQTNGKAFNRAALMNIGFLEASKLYSWDCFIFHDVDLLPLDDRNLYTCPDQPRHMSVAIDIFGFKLPYRSLFGGVSAMTSSQFKKVNGFSNSFWGWGGEDDDMSNRLKHANFHISRYPVNIARYMMLNHQKEKANPKRYENLANGAKKFETDGINSVKYDIYSSKKFPLFTWFLVELRIAEHR